MRGLVLLVLLLKAGWLMPQSFTPTDKGSTVSFVIRNFGFNIEGNFSGLEGKIIFDPQDPAHAVFSVSIQAASVNTGIDMRDNDLRKSGYLDVNNFPRIIFESTQVSLSRKKDQFLITGNLELKGVIHEISFPFSARPENGGYRFDGQFKINRRDFGVGGASLTLSDNLNVSLSVFASK